jgi:hypothetical protein
MQLVRLAVGLGIGLTLVPLVGEAQSPEKVHRVGYLSIVGGRSQPLLLRADQVIE